MLWVAERNGEQANEAKYNALRSDSEEEALMDALVEELGDN